MLSSVPRSGTELLQDCWPAKRNLFGLGGLQQAFVCVSHEKRSSEAGQWVVQESTEGFIGAEETGGGSAVCSAVVRSYCVV